MHLPNAMIQESVRAFWSGWYGELVTALPVIENGMVAAPDGPGLGHRAPRRRSSSARMPTSARRLFVIRNGREEPMRTFDPVPRCG